MRAWLRLTILVFLAVQCLWLHSANAKVSSDSLAALEAAEQCRLFQQVALRGKSARVDSAEEFQKMEKQVAATRASLEVCAKANNLGPSRTDLDEVKLATACNHEYRLWVEAGLGQALLEEEAAETGRSDEQLSHLAGPGCPLASVAE